MIVIMNIVIVVVLLTKEKLSVTHLYIISNTSETKYINKIPDYYDCCYY